MSERNKNSDMNQFPRTLDPHSNREENDKSPYNWRDRKTGNRQSCLRKIGSGRCYMDDSNCRRKPTYYAQQGQSSNNNWRGRITNGSQESKQNNPKEQLHAEKEFNSNRCLQKWPRTNLMEAKIGNQYQFNGRKNSLLHDFGAIKKKNLEAFLKEDPNNIVQDLLASRSELVHILQQPSLEDEIVMLLIKVIGKGLACRMPQENLNHMIEIISESNLFKLHLPMHASNLIHNSNLNDAFSDLIIIFQLVLDRLPKLGQEKLQACITSYNKTMEITASRNFQSKPEIMEKHKNIQAQTQPALIPKSKKVYVEEKNLHKNEKAPPNNCADLPILPTLREIVNDMKPFLRENITKGKYTDLHHYIDVHFRLLREDYIAPLRDSICKYLKTKAATTDKQLCQDVRLYHGVRIAKRVDTQEGICYEIQFDTQPFQRTKWEKSPKLIFGSLLCLSHDNFRTVKFATIVSRDVETLKLGILTIKIESIYNSYVPLRKYEMNPVYIMVESPVYFEAYRHILRYMLAINAETMPFQDYLIQTNNKTRQPTYLDTTRQYFLPCGSGKPATAAYGNQNAIRYDDDDNHRINNKISCNDRTAIELMRNCGYLIPVPKITELISWPSAENMDIDESQKNAMHLALTSSVAVIQGSPGTGKTFVGLKIVETLLANAKVYRCPVTPILIVCLSNPALDEILKGILKLTDSVTRVGGQSPNAELTSCDLKTKVFWNKQPKRLYDLYEEIRELEAKINETENLLQRWDSIILHEQILKLLPQPDAEIVEEMVADYISVSENKSGLQSWLGVLLDDAVDECELQEFYFGDEEKILDASLFNEIVHETDIMDDTEDDTLIQVESEATMETKNRMLVNGNNFSTDTMMSKPRFVFQNLMLEIDKIKEQYLMVDEKKYRNVDKTKGGDSNRCNQKIKENCYIRYHIAKRELAIKDTTGDDKVRKISENISAVGVAMCEMTLRKRWSFYRRWRNLCKQELIQSINKWRDQYIQKKKQWKDFQSHKEKALLKKSKIIGMTIAAVAKYQPVLHEIGCKVAIVEEAAEILECQIIATISPTTEHLILIGDYHQQTRPKPTVHYLAEQFKFNFSLFERLIANGLPYATLQEQHRTQQDISQLNKSHSHLMVHESADRPSISNKMHHIPFMNKSQVKDEAFESNTPKKMCQKKKKCGHVCKRIWHTDLCGPCKEPCQRICSRNHPCPLLCHEVCKPCKVIVDMQLKCGHKISTRCSFITDEYKCRKTVQFSDCQHKMTVDCHIPNETLSCNKDCDFRLECGHKCNLKCHPLENQEHIGIDLECKKPCQRKICTEIHGQEKCKNLCNENCSKCTQLIMKKLSCNHSVLSECGQNNIICTNTCERILSCGHKCKNQCIEPCGECREMVDKPLPCTHVVRVECCFKNWIFQEMAGVTPRKYRLMQEKSSHFHSTSREGVRFGNVIKVSIDETIDYVCQNPCKKIMACGHLCQEICKDKCSTTCKRVIPVRGLCGHNILIECLQSKINEDALCLYCIEPCGKILPCGHPCTGTCGLCRQGRVHVVCKNKCGRVHFCGHSCDIPCAETCPPCNKTCSTRCVHSRCPGKCGQPCTPCVEMCDWRCCHYECTLCCGEYCNRPRCNEPCRKLLPCRHPCLGLCGEPCPPLCRKCRPQEIKDLMLFGNEDDKNARFVQLEDCGHCLEVGGLDQWMDIETNEIQMKSCPRCKTPIWKSHRYGNIIRNCLENVQKVKKQVFGSVVNLRDNMKRLLTTLNNCTEIRRVFEKFDATLRRRLRPEFTLNHNACNVVENQILLLAGMSKTIEKNKNKSKSVEEYLRFFLNNLAERLMENEERINEHELESINREFRRVTLVVSFIELEELYLKSVNSGSNMAYNLTIIKSILYTGSQLTDAEEDGLKTLITDLKRNGGLGISEEERVMIVKAINLGQGRWFKCPNGHIYAIGECGGAMETSICNECGSPIGGTSHNLLPSNSHAGEMDKSKVPAWSAASDMANFGSEEFQ